MRRHLLTIASLLAFTSTSILAFALSSPAPTRLDSPRPIDSSNLSIALFAELEELSRIVDISYCVGTTGIQRPFRCASRCEDFEGFELVETFNTGALMSDSCGYVALDHGRRGLMEKQKEKRGGRKGRVIVAFRGTYSIANTIVDLSTVPQEYVPYPDEPDEEGDPVQVEEGKATCLNCTVHTGFWTSWQNTRPFVLPHVKAALEQYPEYDLHLVGHSLGGAVAGLAGLEFEGMGLKPTITTFGEPRIGNSGLRDWIDLRFSLPSEHLSNSTKSLKAGRYRRLTHVDDPVPLLPLQEWGYRAHAGEIYISKPDLQPSITDVRLCYGDEDVDCIAAAEVDESWFNAMSEIESDMEPEDEAVLQKRWGFPIPARYKMWQLFFAHRDYFWRLGLCLPGGDPLDWGRGRYHFGDEDGVEDEVENDEL